MRTSSSLFSKNFIFLLLSSFLFFFIFSIPHSLEACLFNPLLAKDQPGFAAFLEGKTYFEAEKWEEAICCFEQAIQESQKPIFDCDDFVNECGDSACSDCGWRSKEGIYYFLTTIKGAVGEAHYSLYRHSHFHLGLILYIKETQKMLTFIS